MPRQLAFRFEAQYCIGCQTCRIACDDAKGRLGEGGAHAKISFRRVSESESGGFEREGSGYVSRVRIAYRSKACRHCAKPACLAACPAGAISKREKDGIVLVDASRCSAAGGDACGRCARACPFGAISLDPETGVAEKCDFCVDRVDSGLEPACVASCPMRALHCGFSDELRGASRGEQEGAPGAES